MVRPQTPLPIFAENPLMRFTNFKVSLVVAFLVALCGQTFAAQDTWYSIGQNDSRRSFNQIVFVDDTITTSSTAFINAESIASSPASLTITNQPDQPRTLTFTQSENSGSALVGTYTVSGFDTWGNPAQSVVKLISDDNEQTKIAYSSITSITCTFVSAAASDTISVGGYAFGLNVPLGAITDAKIEAKIDFDAASNKVTLVTDAGTVNGTYGTYLPNATTGDISYQLIGKTTFVGQTIPLGPIQTERVGF